MGKGITACANGRDMGPFLTLHDLLFSYFSCGNQPVMDACQSSIIAEGGGKTLIPVIIIVLVIILISKYLFAWRSIFIACVFVGSDIIKALCQILEPNFTIFGQLEVISERLRLEFK